jgi:hypothetical protein
MNNIKEDLKTLIDNGIRFKSYTNTIEIEEIIRHKEQDLTMTRDELNKLYLKARHDYRYLDTLKNEFLTFSFSVDELIIGTEKKESNINKLSEIKKEFFNHEILCLDFLKKSKQVRIIMIKKDDITLLNDESNIEDVKINKVIDNNVVAD